MNTTKNIEIEKSKYPENTRIYIDYISDNSCPDAVGQYATVHHVDDQGQVHCLTDNHHNVAVCHAYGDMFYKV